MSDPELRLECLRIIQATGYDFGPFELAREAEKLMRWVTGVSKPGGWVSPEVPTDIKAVA